MIARLPMVAFAQHLAEPVVLERGVLGFGRIQPSHQADHAVGPERAADLDRRQDRAVAQGVERLRAAHAGEDLELTIREAHLRDHGLVARGARVGRFERAHRPRHAGPGVDAPDAFDDQVRGRDVEGDGLDRPLALLEPVTSVGPLEGA